MSEVFARLQARIASLPSNAEGMRQALARADHGAALSPPSPIVEEAQNMPIPLDLRKDAQARWPSHGQNQEKTGEPPHGEPQGDRLKELLLPFEPWPATLSLDSAGRIQVKASRLLLPQMQAYCLQHEPELKAFLKSRPGHAWSTMRKS